MPNMASGTLRLRGRELLEQHDVSMYRMRESGAASYPTIHKYMTTPDKIDYMSLKVLYGILIDGLGYTPEEAARLRMGDVFDFVQDEEDDAAQ